jgi:hypothetical protein
MDRVWTGTIRAGQDRRVVLPREETVGLPLPPCRVGRVRLA